jgi:hypothetical protein
MGGGPPVFYILCFCAVRVSLSKPHKNIYVKEPKVFAKSKPAGYNRAVVLTAKPVIKTSPGAAAITCPAHEAGTPATHNI